MCLATTALLFSLTGCDTAPPAEDPPRLASALVEGQVVDLRAEFSQSFCGLFEKRSDLRAGFEHCEQVLHQTPVVVQQPSAAETQRSARVYLVPGLFGECVERLVTPWKIARSHLERLGYTVELVEVGGRSGIERNARLIRDHLMASPQDGRRSIALGYSKGAIDLLEALRAYPELHPRIDAAVAVAGPIHGAPLAESSPDWLTRLATWLRLPDCSPGDGLGIASMTPKQRRMADPMAAAGIGQAVQPRCLRPAKPHLAHPQAGLQTPGPNRPPQRRPGAGWRYPGSWQQPAGIRNRRPLGHRAAL